MNQQVALHTTSVPEREEWTTFKYGWSLLLQGREHCSPVTSVLKSDSSNLALDSQVITRKASLILTPANPQAAFRSGYCLRTPGGGGGGLGALVSPSRPTRPPTSEKFSSGKK